MHKPAQSNKSSVSTISNEVETLRKLINDIEVLSETLESELLHESMSITSVTAEKGHSLVSLSGQISHMTQKALQVRGILQNISIGLGSFVKGGSIE